MQTRRTNNFHFETESFEIQFPSAEGEVNLRALHAQAVPLARYHYHGK